MMRMLGNLLMSALGLAILAFAISFAASNDSIVSISLWPLQHAFSMPVWLVGLGGFGAGLIIGSIVMSLPLIASKWQQGRLNRQIKTLEKQRENNTSGDDSLPRLPKS